MRSECKVMPQSITCQQMAALKCHKLGQVLWDPFFHFSCQQVAVLRGCVAIVSEMEAYTKHSSRHFKQHAVINLWLPKESLQLKFTPKYALFMVMTVLMWALCNTGPKHTRMVPGRADLCDKQLSGWPVTATDEIHKKKVDKLIKDNEHITQREAAVKLGILQECVDHIILCPSISEGVCMMGSSHADGTDESFKSWNLPATFVTLREWRWGISSKCYDS